MTYGQIRMRLSQLLPGIDLDLVDGWIRDRYTQILDALKWQRREVQAVIQTAAPIDAGTITLTEGSTTVSGVATGWTSAITGWRLYVASRNEWYGVTYVSAVALTLDRAYEGGTSAGASYKLYKPVYVLPAACRILKSVTSLANGPLGDWQPWMNAAPTTLGTPQAWRLTMDSATDPPQQQIELYPIPDAVEGLAIEYTAEDTTFSAAGVTLLPWVREGCLVAGVESDGLAHQEKFAAADRKEARFMVLLADMQRTETQRTPAKAIRVSGKYSANRFLNVPPRRTIRWPE